MKSKCAPLCIDKRVLVLCDTTEFNINNHRGRITDFEGIGATSNNSSLGFFSHNLMVVDRDKKSPLGWSDIHLFNRPVDNIAYTRPNSSVPIEEKESYKWIGPCLDSKKSVLKQSAHVLFVMDREADIYEVMERLPDSKSDILIRMRHDRKVINSNNEKIKVIDDIGQAEVRHRVEFEVTGESKKRKKRIAKCEIRWASYKVPRSKKVYDKNSYLEHIQMTAIQILETKDSCPSAEQPIEWTLWYSGSIEREGQAEELVECYRARWMIEEAHRLLKKKGFDIESTELEKGKSIRKLLLLGMDAATKIMQLKAARDGATHIKVSQVFTEEEIECLVHMNEQLEGSTDKLSNPYETNTLPWASWVIARLGGWKGYKSQRPPGTIIFQRGYDSFKERFLGYQLMKEVMYKR